MNALKQVKKNSLGFALAACCLLLAQIPQALAAKAGDVVMAIGQTSAKNAQNVRELKRGAELAEQDTLVTGKGSSLQVRFVDGGRLTLQENSSLALETYVHQDPQGKPNAVVMNLAAGGFRTITGLVGKINNQDYLVKTPVGSIGIRGTIYGAQLSEDLTELTVYIQQGSVIVFNDLGSIVLDTTGNNPSVATVKKGNAPAAAGTKEKPPANTFRLPREEDDIRQSPNESEEGDAFRNDQFITPPPQQFGG